MKVVIDSRLRLSPEVVAELGSERLDELRCRCTHANPEHVMWKGLHGRAKGKARYMMGKEPPRTISTARREPDGGWSFPRGRASELLELVGASAVDDLRVRIKAPTVEWLGPAARPYQARLIDTGLRSLGGWTNGVWRSPPASGKTNAALELVARLGQRSLVIVPTSAIMTQWIARARTNLGIEPGVIQGSKCTIGPLLTLGMQQTLWKCAPEVAHEFGAVIFDETQYGAARTWQEVVDVFPAVFRLGVSGDERRADGKEFLIYDQFGPVSAEVTKDEVLASGGMVPVEVVIVPTEFEAGWYKKLQPVEKFRRRVVLIDKMTDDESRNALAVSLARREVAAGEQVIVLSDRREHCVRLDAAAAMHGSSILLIGGDPEFEANRDLFARGTARFAVGTYKAIGVGFESHRELSRGVMTTPVGSNDKAAYQFRQYLGRFARSVEGKRRARVYYLLDVRVFGKHPAALIKRWIGKDLVSVEVGGRRVPVGDWLKGTTNEGESTGGDGEQGGFFGFE